MNKCRWRWGCDRLVGQEFADVLRSASTLRDSRIIVRCQMPSLNERTTIVKSFFSVAKMLRIIVTLTAAVFAVPGQDVNGRESHFLNGGDDAVLVSPRADFEIELNRLSLGNSPFHAVEGENEDNAAGEAAKGEAADLAAALK